MVCTFKPFLQIYGGLEPVILHYQDEAPHNRKRDRHPRERKPSNAQELLSPFGRVPSVLGCEEYLWIDILGIFPLNGCKNWVQGEL